MLIIDALRRAGTAQEVCYLLTSYVETLQFYDTIRQLPAQVKALPVRGLGDIAARLASLQDVLRDRALASSTSDCAILDEAIHLFGEALYRLNALDGDDVAHFSFDRRAAARPSSRQHL